MVGHGQLFLNPALFLDVEHHKFYQLQKCLNTKMLRGQEAAQLVLCFKRNHSSRVR